MYVEMLSLRPRSGAERELLKALEQRAALLFGSPGCYGAYVLREGTQDGFSCLSFWTDPARFLDRFPDGPPSVPEQLIDGRPSHRTFAAASQMGPGIPLVTYFGLRVTDFERSTLFYTTILGFEPVTPARVNAELHSRNVMLRHPRTGQQLELNWYPPGGQFGVPFVAGEALDHIGVRVPDVPRVLEKAHAIGCEPADLRPFREFPFHTGPNGIRLAYLLDPDGNQIEVYDVASMSVDAPFYGEY
ncbi:MAG: VOC family protein [Thermoplasmata archaeon]|nr:VOC family protein [Thermoplasmata archaeon]MCI4337874.1 VOC family protein [Thermoplasmata archaeon]MCI4341518.1 VOC family protein [Thermoplasmata archaeon]